MSKRPYWGQYKKKKKKKIETGESRRKEELKLFHFNPQQGHFSRAPLSPLYEAPAILEDVGTRGHLGLAKNSKGRGLDKSGIPSRTFGWSP